MIDFISEICNRAKKLEKRIVFPEGDDSRILKAAELITKSKIAKVILIGDKTTLEENAKNASADLSKVTIISPSEYAGLDNFAAKYSEKMKMKPEEAKSILEKDYAVFAGMMVDQNEADGLVMGATHTTAETIRIALHCVGVDPDISLISSFFMMVTENNNVGEEGVIFFADCGVVPNPNPEELATIAISTANSFRKLLFSEPRVAMLSFSTKGSAKHPDVDKVIAATNLVKLKMPDLVIDGEMQADAAIVPSVAKKKAPESSLAGDANILIFPNLDSGNIGYKLTQRLAKINAYGPIFQGTIKPVNDLSRGCTIEDIVNVTAITAVQSN